MQLRFIARRVSELTGELLPLVRPEDIESATGRLVGRSLGALQLPDSGLSLVAARANDILFCKLRPYLAKVLFVEKPLCAASELLVIRPRAGVDPEWLFYLLSSPSFIDFAIQTSEGSKMPRTSWEKLAEFDIDALPSLSVQKQIAGECRQALRRISQSIDQIDVIRSELVALRPQVLAGKFG